MKDFLVLTEDIKESVINHYPLLGNPKELWAYFMHDVEKNYLKWESILTPENYPKMFYVFLNNTKPSELEYLQGKI